MKKLALVLSGIVVVSNMCPPPFFLKKNYSKLILPYFLYLMVSFLLFVSCNQESLIENAEESQVNSLVSINCNDDIVENYINMAALSLIELIPQRSFVDEVHSEVAKMFDDDHDVLF